jgi:hypothetical protein
VLRPDLDNLDALRADRDAQWARLQATTFLTDDEKRAAVGYGPKPAAMAQKYSPDQPRDEQGRWTDGGTEVTEGEMVPTAGKQPPKGPPSKQPEPEPTAKGKGKFQRNPDVAPRDERPDKVRVPGQSKRENKDDVPSFAEGYRPKVGESNDEFAERVLKGNYGKDYAIKDRGADSEFSKIRKWATEAWQ